MMADYSQSEATVGVDNTISKCLSSYKKIILHFSIWTKLYYRISVTYLPV